MSVINVKMLMTSAGVLALTTGFAAAAPAIVQSSVNVRSGPGIDYDVIGALPGGATVNVMGCSGAWCQVNFGGTLGFASRGYLGIGGVAMGPPAYERSYAYGGYAPGYGYREGYAPGYEASVAYGGEREFRGARGFRDESEYRSEERGPARASEIQGPNPMLNPKNEAPAAANARAEGTRTGGRNARGTQAATTGAGTGNRGQDRGPNFIGAGAKFRDNHP